jgi:hypothetical protein
MFPSYLESSSMPFRSLFAAGASAALALALVSPASVCAQVVFEGSFPRALPLAPGESAVVDLPIRNLGAGAAVEQLRAHAFILPPGAYRLEAASDCPVPSLFIFDTPSSIELQPGQRRDCAYRIVRGLDSPIDTRVSFSLGPSGSFSPERSRAVPVGDLVELRTSFSPIGAARLQDGAWIQSGEWRISNLGPTALSQVEYGICTQGLPARVVSTGPECSIAGGAPCFTGQAPTGLRTGPIAVGETRVCRVELSSTFVPYTFDLYLQSAHKQQGGTAELIDLAASMLTLRGVGMTAPRQVPALSAWASILLASLLLAALTVSTRLR